MSRIMIPPDPAINRRGEESDSDDSGDEGSGARIQADPEAKGFAQPLPRAAFATHGTGPIVAGSKAPSSVAATPHSSQPSSSSAAPVSFAVPPRKKSLNEFIASATFTGPKAGFIFKNGPDGMGYYKDPNFAQNNVGTGLTSASRLGSGLPGAKTSESREMLNLLKQKEVEENAKPRSSTIPMDDEEDEDDQDQEQKATQGSSSVFSKMTKKLSKTAEDIKANIKRRQEEASQQAAPEPLKPDTPRPSGDSASQSSPTRAVPPIPTRSAVPPAPVAQASSPTPVTPQTNAPAVSKPTLPPATPVSEASKSRKSPDEVLKIVCEDLGFGLPSGVMRLEGFSSVVRVGNLLYTTAHGPQLPTQGFVRGRVGQSGMDMDSAQVAASLATFSVLRTLTEELGSLDHVKSVVKISGQVACTNEKSSALLLDVLAPMRNILTAVFSCSEPVVSVAGVTCLPHEIPLQAEFVFLLQ